MNAGDGLRLRPPADGADGARRAEVEVAVDSPWFSGHFPGEPVLPAMAQIGLVARLALAPLAGLDGVRFARAVQPGDRLVVSLAAAGAAGRARFALTRGAGGGAVSDGVALLGDAAATPPTAAAELRDATPPGGRAADPGAVLPHAPPARLAETVLRLGDAAIACLGSVPPGHPSVAAGRAGAWMALELAAQAAGILQAAREARKGEEGEAEDGGRAPRVGYIVRLRDVRFARPDLPAGEPLVATVIEDGGGGPLSLFRACVELAGEALASAVLATFVPAR